MSKNENLCINEEEKDSTTKKDTRHTEITVGFVATDSAYQSTQKAKAKFTKPSKYDRSVLDDGSAKRNIKNKQFKSNVEVNDPYTGARLTLTKAEAKAKYGSGWTEHLAESDHTISLEQRYEQTKNSPWLTNEDIKKSSNSADNLKVTSRKFNNAKRKRSNEKFVSDDEYLNQKGVEISDQGKKQAIIDEKKALRAIKKQDMQQSAKNALKTGYDAGVQAACYAGVAGATMSGITNIVAVVRGEKSIDDAIVDTAMDTGASALTGGVVGGTLTVVSHTLTSSSSPFLQKLAASNVPGKVLTGVMVTGGTIIRYAQGEISTKECLLELGDKGCYFGGSYAGGVLGQTIIPIPIVGSAIGSMVGGTLTSRAYNYILQEWQAYKEEDRKRRQAAFEAMMKAYAEEKRRNEVKRLIQVNTENAFEDSIKHIVYSGEIQQLIGVVEAYEQEYKEIVARVAERVLVALCLKDYREQLQHCVDSYFAECRQYFDMTLDGLDASLNCSNYDEAILACNQITKAFSQTGSIKSTDDFKSKIFGRGKISF